MLKTSSDGSIRRSMGGFITKIHAQNTKPIQFFLARCQSPDYTKTLDL